MEADYRARCEQVGRLFSGVRRLRLEGRRVAAMHVCPRLRPPLPFPGFPLVTEHGPETEVILLVPLCCDGQRSPSPTMHSIFVFRDLPTDMLCASPDVHD
eukprot:scaffold89045_cov32-Tisochrysis_lutea.AAC.9